MKRENCVPSIGDGAVVGSEPRRRFEERKCTDCDRVYRAIVGSACVWCKPCTDRNLSMVRKREPEKSCVHPPGSEGKIAEMERRYARGEELWHRGDARPE